MCRTVGATLLAVMAVSVSAPGQVAGKRGDSPERQVTDLTAQWLEAARTRNVDFLQKLFASELEELSSSGHVLTKAQLIERLNSPDWIVDELHSEVINVHVYGSAAVLTDRTTIRVHDAKGVASGGTFRFIRVFANRHGKWQAVAAQATRLND